MEVSLYRQQNDFLKSPALYRAFAAGIGAGKSWAGSYDLIRRGKPNRLYMIAAPTYPMLADATFRSFVSVAESLGVVNQADIKKSAPPSLMLRTGAEVIFRSTDNPESLRGPNLSGIWLDEASLMHEDAFNVCIGRLREGGEQGWLSATFTPKGKSHWTHETFAGDRPDTAIFRARTKDNPFLPPGFYETLKRQYASQMAAQELEGEFIDGGGLMFRMEWFKDKFVDAAPFQASRVRYWDKAASEKTGDYSAGVKVAKTEDGKYFVEDVYQGQWSSGERNQRMIFVAEMDGAAHQDTEIWVEQEPGSGGKESAEYSVRELAKWPVYAHKPTGEKYSRMQPAAAQAEQGNIFIVRGPWNREFLDQLCGVPFSKHDDMADAFAGSFNKLASKMSVWSFGTAPERESVIASMPADASTMYRGGAVSSRDDPNAEDEEDAGVSFGAYDQ